MIKNEFLAKVYKTPLERDQNTFKYTLGDKKLDDLFDLDEMTAGFTPSRESVLNFAAATYLYGVIGYKTTNFTSVPGGFLVTYQKENEGSNDVVTILVTDNKGLYWLDELKELYNRELANQNYNDSESDIIMHIRNKIMDFNKVYDDLIGLCPTYADQINENKACFNLKKNIEEAIFPFSFSKEPMSLNAKNCNDNHMLLDMFCAKELGLDYDVLVDEAITFGQQGTEDQLKQIEDMRNDILNGWILPGYYTFVGNKRGIPTARDAQILNNEKWFEELEEKVKNPKALAAIVNMCATDYTADVVYGMLDMLNNSNIATNNLMSVSDLADIMPLTPNNKNEVARIRKNFWRKYYAKSEGYEIEE